MVFPTLDHLLASLAAGRLAEDVVLETVGLDGPEQDLAGAQLGGEGPEQDLAGAQLGGEGGRRAGVG